MLIRYGPMMMSLLVLAMIVGCSSTKEPVPQEPVSEKADSDAEEVVSETSDAGAMRRGPGGRGRGGRGPGGGRRGRSGYQPDDTNQLKVGDVAPAFTLKSLDNKEETSLASFKGKMPVVLFFGSYT